MTDEELKEIAKRAARAPLPNAWWDFAMRDMLAEIKRLKAAIQEAREVLSVHSNTCERPTCPIRLTSAILDEALEGGEG